MRYNQQLTKLAARKEGLQSPLTLETMSKYSRIKRKGSTRLLLTMGDKNNNLIFHCIEKDKISYENYQYKYTICNKQQSINEISSLFLPYLCLGGPGPSKARIISVSTYHLGALVALPPWLTLPKPPLPLRTPSLSLQLRTLLLARPCKQSHYN